MLALVFLLVLYRWTVRGSSQLTASPGNWLPRTTIRQLLCDALLFLVGVLWDIGIIATRLAVSTVGWEVQTAADSIRALSIRNNPMDSRGFESMGVAFVARIAPTGFSMKLTRYSSLARVAEPNRFMLERSGTESLPRFRSLFRVSKQAIRS